MYLQLHEDSPISDYVNFPVIELDISLLNNPSINWSTADCFRLNITNDFIYQAIGANMPKTRKSNGCIMQSLCILDDGKQEGTEIEAYPLGSSQPQDWGSNVHYMTARDVDGTQIYVPTAVFTYSGTVPTYYSSTQYYIDTSEPENRRIRKLISDNGLSFCVHNYITNGEYNAPYTVTGFAFCPGNIGNTLNNWYRYPYFFSLNGSTLNLFGSQYVCAYYQGKFDKTDLENENPIVTFFAHTTYNGTEYIGICLARMSDTTEDAYPKYLAGVFFNQETYFEQSVIPSYDNVGTWGPVSQQSGGNGTWDETTESVVDTAISSLPSIAISGVAGFIQAYTIDNANLINLYTNLFEPSNNNNFWSRWQNYKFNPLSGIISLHLLPSLFTPVSTTTVYVHAAGASFSPVNGYTGVSATILNSQYIDTQDFTLSIPEFFGSSFDYEPFTKMKLHLPFCGTLEISPDDCNGGSISIKYRCDVFTGNVGARVKLSDRFGAEKSFTVTGNCAYTMPVIGRDDGSVQNVLSLASGGIGALASAISGNAIGVAGSIADSAVDIAARKSVTTVSGSVSSNSASVSDLYLWLEISRPSPSYPDSYRELEGIPSNIAVSLFQMQGSGFISVEECHVENIVNATENEKEEIYKLLKDGIII